MRLLWRQARTEFVMLWRNPASLVFAILFPLILLVVLSSVFGTSGFVSTPQGQESFISFYLPGVVAFAGVQSCFSNLATTLTSRRETGILKRKRGTPLPAWALVGGLVLAESVLALLLTLVTTAVAMAGWGLALPRHPVAVVATVVLGAACFCAVAIAFTVVIPNEDAAPAVINAVAFPLLFISGIWFVNRGAIRTVSRVFPVARMRDAIADAYAPAAHHCQQVRDSCSGLDRVTHAAGPHLLDLAVMAIWLVAAVAFAVRFFHWEPRHH